MLVRKYVQVVPSKLYSRIIEVDVPTKFYWNGDGSFDGLEFKLPRKITKHQLLLLNEILNRLHIVLQEAPVKTTVPDVYLRAFREKSNEQGSKDT